MLNRRRFLAASVSASVSSAGFKAAGYRQSTLLTRGVVSIPEDLTLTDWPERAKRGKLTTIGIHHQNSPQAVIDWIKKDEGQRFLEACKKLGLAVEYELHAMKELLPRRLFEKYPELFRLDEKGNRSPDANCCPHSGRALEVIAEKAVAVAQVLRPTTSRYFYWGDDGQPWCSCRECTGLIPSDQALLVENAILRALHGIEPTARLAHLAYANTLSPPRAVKPVPGIFLEYAPIKRRYDMPYKQQTAPGQPDALSALDANLEVFPADTAQVLEYCSSSSWSLRGSGFGRGT
jgi:hypothetical protein